MRKKLLAIGLAVMMVLALGGVALADSPGDCNVTFTVLDMEEQAVNDVDVRIDGTDYPTSEFSNTVTVTLEQHRHYDAEVQGPWPPLRGWTQFYTGDNLTMEVTIYMLYDAHGEGDTTRVFFEVTDAIGVTLHADWDKTSIRAGQTEFEPVQFAASVSDGMQGETYKGTVEAFTMENDGSWVVVGWGEQGDYEPQSGEIAFEISPDDVATYEQFEPTGQTLPSDFYHENWDQEFWLKGITHASTPANTMGNIYFKLTVTLQ